MKYSAKNLFLPSVNTSFQISAIIINFHIIKNKNIRRIISFNIIYILEIRKSPSLRKLLPPFLSLCITRILPSFKAIHHRFPANSPLNRHPPESVQNLHKTVKENKGCFSFMISITWYMPYSQFRIYYNQQPVYVQ